MRGVATITILTDPVAAAAEEAVEREPSSSKAAEIHEGTVLAQVLRSLADKVEQDIMILPTAGNYEWANETHRHATRLSGVLIGTVLDLTREA